MGKQNLRYSLRTAVFTAFREHTDKHGLRKAGDDRQRVYSYGSRGALLDRASDFGRWGQAQGAKTPEDVTQALVRGYLDSKASTCTQNTLDEYRSEIGRLGRLCGQDWSCDRVLADRARDSQRGAQAAMPRSELDQILDYGKKHPCGSSTCIRLEAEIGARVAEVSYGIRVDGDTLHLRGKNGKIYTREITPAVREIMETPQWQQLVDGDRLCGPKDDSINRYLRRVEDRLGLERHSMHDIRRLLAQERYDDDRHRGMGRSEALSEVSQWLNHGADREQMMLRSYISNAW